MQVGSVRQPVTIPGGTSWNMSCAHASPVFMRRRQVVRLTGSGLAQGRAWGPPWRHGDRIPPLPAATALELAPKIRVNTIIPGLVVTEETRDCFGLDDQGTLGERQAAVPLRRLGQPGDIAEAVMLALAAEAQFITGQKIVVDGGRHNVVSSRLQVSEPMADLLVKFAGERA